jgi:two-component system chemotaxis response regulator CheB
MPGPLKILIVDDSSFIRRVYRDMLNGEPDMQVIGEAEDPIQARDFMKHHQPDVITLDIEMPRMDGLSFLKKLMARRPTPVVMSSTLTQKGADITLQALEAGAVEVVAKPVDGGDINRVHEELVSKVRAAATARLNLPPRPIAPPPDVSRRKLKPVFILLGASTGGVETLRSMLSGLPALMPPILLTQHMPVTFTTSFARNLNRASSLTVELAQSGTVPLAGHVYLAPGDRHLQLRHKGGNTTLHLDDGDPVSGHKPSVDVMFQSAAESGLPCIAALLTGMGKDGAKGLLALRESGAHTIAQDEQSCVVYGMPKAAVQIGAVSEELPPERIIARLLELSYA